MTVQSTAPLDLAASLEAGYTLPATWYTSPEVYELEKRFIFHRSWQYVCLAEHLAQPGDFVTCRAGDIPLVVVRDTEGKLGAFVNVCRHRGSELVLQPCGNRKSIQCHYHAWTYGLDGSLRSAPGERNEPGFVREGFSLRPVQVDVWGPFVFVSPDLAAPPLSSVLGELPAMVENTGLDLGAIRRRVRHQYDIAANWKVVVDNYLECYHCPVAHPGFSNLIDVNDYHITPYEYFSVQVGSLKESSREKPYAVREGVEDGFYAYLWPTFMVNIYPGPGNVSLNLIVPLAPDRTLAVYEYCFVDAVGDDEVEEFVGFIDQVQREDIVLCESVQRGLKSGQLEHGKLMLSRESGLQHFQALVHAAVSSRE